QSALVLAGFEAGFQGQATLIATLQFSRSDGTADQVRSVSVPVLYDTLAPGVQNIFFPAGQGQIDGWFAGDGPDIEVRAQVADGPLGSGLDSAQLQLVPCNARVACSYPGTLLGATASLGGTYSF